jgi:PAS domain S-box-containing protein
MASTQPTTSADLYNRSEGPIRWHHLFYVLGAVNLLVILLALYVGRELWSAYEHSITVNQQWTEAASEQVQLGALIAALNAPGNDVFASLDVPGETARLHEALRKFKDALAASRIHASRLSPSLHAPVLLAQLNSVEESVNAMVAETERIFVDIEAAHRDRASARMAAMDRLYAHSLRTLDQLHLQIKAVQAENFGLQAAAATQTKTLGIVVIVGFLLMVAGTAGYGRMLARRHAQELAESHQVEAQLRQQEEELTRSREQLLRVIEASELGYWDWNAITGEVKYSGRWMTMLGYDEGELDPSHETWENLVHPDDKARVLASLRAHLDGRSHAFVEEHRLRMKSGQWRWILTQGRVVTRDATGRAVYVSGIHRDIHDRKQVEVALQQTQAQLVQSQKMEAIGRLAGGVAHDFNNLLTVINGNHDMLLAGPMDTAEAREALEQMGEAGRRAADLTRQLLIFSRKQVVQPRIIAMNQIVSAMHKLLNRVIGEDIWLRLTLSQSLNHILLDPSQLEQIIMNLAVNARDAMPSGGDLELATRNVELDEAFLEQQGMASIPGPYCMLSVRDTGIGMDEQTVGRIFEPFFTTKGLGKGTGLGLATVYGIVQQGQGVIAVSTQPGQGTTFRVYFPQALSVVSQDGVAVTTSAAIPGGTETILLIEDEPLVRSLVKKALSSRGYTVLEAGTGKAAQEASTGYQGQIHLVVSDVILPGERGPLVVEQLKTRRPDMKILFMSGYTGSQSELEDHQLNRYPFISKPFPSHVLLQKVRTVLDSNDALPEHPVPTR